MAVSAESSRAASRAARRAELLAATLRVIRRDGDSVSMEAIAAEAGITRPILYRHFGDVGGLYQAIAEDYAARLLARFGESARGVRDPRRQLHAVIGAFLTFIEDEPHLYRFLTRQLPRERPEQRDVEVEFVRLIASSLASVFEQAGMPAGLARSSSDALVGGVRAAADHWLDHGDPTRTVLANQLTALYWGGLEGFRDRQPRSGRTRSSR